MMPVALALLLATNAPVNAEQARGVLRTHCGECHVGGSAGANAAAVAVFDLSSSAWFEKLDARKLREAEHRLQGKKPSAEDRRAFHAFVESRGQK
jgi:hypothetical protein